MRCNRNAHQYIGLGLEELSIKNYQIHREYHVTFAAIVFIQTFQITNILFKPVYILVTSASERAF
jgi:hypothetical protein